MDRREFLQGTAASLSLALGKGSLSQTLGQQTPRRLLLYVDETLGAQGKRIHDRIQDAARSAPLLNALCSGQPIVAAHVEGPLYSDPQQFAYNHILCVARPGNKVLEQLWQREAVLSAGSLHVFGFGSFHGSVGYVESDRNPFLHAANIVRTPFESQAITVTGTDDAGIQLAVDAFVERGLANGLVAEDGQWKRSGATLLDRDPLSPSFNIPAVVPHTLDSMTRIAITQASEDEYRGVLMDCGVAPASIWRAKFYSAGAWDRAGQISAFQTYSAGLHRRAFGNTVWAADFLTHAAAIKAAPLIAQQAGLPAANTEWRGNLAHFYSGFPEDGDSPHPGTLELWTDQSFVLIACRSGAMGSG